MTLLIMNLTYYSAMCIIGLVSLSLQTPLLSMHTQDNQCLMRASVQHEPANFGRISTHNLSRRSHQTMYTYIVVLLLLLLLLLQFLLLLLLFLLLMMTQVLPLFCCCYFRCCFCFSAAASTALAAAYSASATAAATTDAMLLLLQLLHVHAALTHKIVLFTRFSCSL